MGAHQGAEQGTCARGPSLGREGEQGAFTHKQHPVRGGAMPDRFCAVLHVLDGGNGGARGMVLHGVQWRAAQCYDPLGHRFNVVVEVSAKRSELALKFKDR